MALSKLPRRAPNCPFHRTSWVRRKQSLRKGRGQPVRNKQPQSQRADHKKEDWGS